MQKVRLLRFVGVASVLLALGCTSRGAPDTNGWVLSGANEGWPERTIRTANDALARNPNDAEAYFQLGIAYSKLDSVNLAYTRFMKSAEIEPRREKVVNINIQSNFERHFDRGLEFEKDEDYTRAVSAYRKAAAADPRRWQAYFQLAVSYLALGLDSDARASLEKALERSDAKSRPTIETMLSGLR